MKWDNKEKSSPSAGRMDIFRHAAPQVAGAYRKRLLYFKMAAPLRGAMGRWGLVWSRPFSKGASRRAFFLT